MDRIVHCLTGFQIKDNTQGKDRWFYEEDRDYYKT